MIGLGRGLVSLISQMGSSFSIDGKFDCLVHAFSKPNSTSEMNFSSKDVVSGSGSKMNSQMGSSLFVGQPKLSIS
ncbi:unnamed protein product [Prunus brigantina]